MAPEQLNSQFSAVVAALPLIDPDHTSLPGQEEKNLACGTSPLQMTLDRRVEFHCDAFHRSFRRSPASLFRR
jgi:hypothetical protein